MRLTLENKYNIDYTRHDRCLVGEAHCFSNKYEDDAYCRVCLNLCGAKARNAIDTGGKTFDNFKHKLFLHMKRVHWRKKKLR